MIKQLVLGEWVKVPSMINNVEVGKRRIRSKTNTLSFTDIPVNREGKLYKKQHQYLCVTCFRKKSEFKGMRCTECRNKDLE